MTERSHSKAERLLRLEQILLAYPEGLRKAEIARKLGVHRATVGRYIKELSLRIPVWQDDNLFGINRDDYLTHVRLTIHESMALHLAARLMATRTDKHNPHAAAALRKLGQALDKFAPLVSRHLLASAEVMDDDARRHDPVYLEVLETLTQAWSQGRMVHLWHRHQSGQVYEYDFAPYFIEPYAIGRTTHVLGWRDPPKDVRTFKLERIQRIEMIKPARPYTIPEEFDPRARLADAWGIWTTEAEPVEVVLKFHPRVAARVQETQWHRSERPEELPDGSLLWRARIAEPKEMLPWIRGWGADVEVLEPEALRAALVQETRRLAAVYGLQPIPTYQLLWAKTDRKDRTQTHPLICHLIDVAQVAMALWQEAWTDSLRAQFAAALDLDPDSAGRLVAFWAGLHDLGKASPCFQRKHKPAQASLAEAGLAFPPLFVREPCPHGTLSADVLRALLETETHLPRRLAGKVARAVGGHHGAWPHPWHLDALKDAQKGDDAAWGTLRRDLLQVLQNLLRPPTVERLGSTPEEENALLTLLSGLTTTADWIGSMERFFPYVAAPVDPARYAERAAVQAQQALAKLGWTGWRPPTEETAFHDLFLFSPRPMQEAVIRLARRLERPALVIIEAPTGAGKTEAALYLADHWARTCRQRGLYIAMPTMATSNQMFVRVQDVLRRRYPQNLVNLHLIHSQARWRDDMQSLYLETFDEGQGGTVAAMAWFLPRKRSLLAPFGVGTVDQALLSVLQARHFFVRLLGLSHKTIIFDEVHAYDTYMSTIFRRLLAWLRAIGASVVILSATLPAQTRRELLQAYVGRQDVPLPQVSYPAVTWATSEKVGAEPLESPADRIVTLEWIEREPEAIADRLRDDLRDGGCAAVICNRVGRAQKVYKAIRDAKIVLPEDLILFHARFPFAWREEVEDEVLGRFGKKGRRPQKAVVVATQVIEQSLDLDFDLMVSDLAPLDLILQRAGRLHRHARNNRPASLSAPRLLIAAPGEKDGAPDFGPDVYIYERYVLLRSYLALRQRERLVLPAETEALIEAVYGDESPLPADLTPAWTAALESARQQMERRRQDEQNQAGRRLIPEPDYRRLLSASEVWLEEDKPELHRALQALTRLIPPGVSLVCLHQTAKGLSPRPDGNGPLVDLTESPSPDLTKELSRYTITVTHRSVVDYFLDQPVPTGWREHPLLHNHRVAIFTDGVCILTGTPYLLRLSRELGLEITKEEAL